jgi:hypothetical protein
MLTLVAMGLLIAILLFSQQTRIYLLRIGDKPASNLVRGRFFDPLKRLVEPHSMIIDIESYAQIAVSGIFAQFEVCFLEGDCHLLDFLH